VSDLRRTARGWWGCAVGKKKRMLVGLEAKGRVELVATICCYTGFFGALLLLDEKALAPSFFEKTDVGLHLEMIHIVCGQK